ncbi:Bacterioferritin (Cytochrome b1) [Candidatus Methylobacter favarea]|uniref:Bacterioferritin (Cytochrome b1) n=1 Tax=Candidatus Methylobacter favarea TaxID=2707345 RepID=A0A8S0WL89_9GAMM|nr:ferritin-like domain-containing protein [Candidatus Methylobacter favarea]CAA9892460.1 Bacterioferritin (Cytochrome b1) [Candidatus Methylobacter favarea]
MSKKLSLANIHSLRKQALHHIDEDALAFSYNADRQRVLKLLNDALAAQLLCVLRYRRHYSLSKDVQLKTIAEEFLVHANEEQWHADQLAERIAQLGGEPELATEAMIITECSAQAREDESLVSMLQEDLLAERNSIANYRRLIHSVGERDYPTRRMLEGILVLEEEHADELEELLESLPEELKKDTWRGD